MKLKGPWPELGEGLQLVERNRFGASSPMRQW